MTDGIHSKSLVPFKKRRGAYQIPGLSEVGEVHPIHDIDQSLNHEEQSYVRHYLNYADMLLHENRTKPDEGTTGTKLKDSKEHAA